jgi:hypothetical protein
MRHCADARVKPMIEILMAALITRIEPKAPPTMPQPNVVDQVRLAVLVVGLLVALVFAATWTGQAQV